jgi:hypothetical protein
MVLSFIFAGVAGDFAGKEAYCIAQTMPNTLIGVRFQLITDLIYQLLIRDASKNIAKEGLFST